MWWCIRTRVKLRKVNIWRKCGRTRAMWCMSWLCDRLWEVEFPKYEVEEVSERGGWLAAKVRRDFRLRLTGRPEVGTVMEINEKICRECQFNQWNITPRRAVTTGSCA